MSHKFDIAISFAGEDRKIAKKFAIALKKRGLSVFFDEFYRAEMWGKPLVEYLEEVFSAESLHCLMLVSQHYIRKPFTSFERRAALARALTETGYILPIRLDNSKIPGLSDDTSYIDFRQTPFRRILELIFTRITVDKVSPDRHYALLISNLNEESLAEPQYDELIASHLESLLSALEIKWASKITRLALQYPNLTSRELLLKLLRQQINRLIELLLIKPGSDMTIKRLVPTAEEPVLPYKFTEVCILRKAMALAPLARVRPDLKLMGLTSCVC